MDAHKFHKGGKVYVGADPAGYGLKRELIPFIEELGLMVVDLGVFKIDEKASCADIAREVGEKVVESACYEGDFEDSSVHGDEVYGILVSDYSDKMVKAASSMKGVKAAVGNFDEDDFAGANILCLGDAEVSLENAKESVEQFVVRS